MNIVLASTLLLSVALLLMISVYLTARIIRLATDSETERNYGEALGFFYGLSESVEGSASKDWEVASWGGLMHRELGDGVTIDGQPALSLV